MYLRMVRGHNLSTMGMVLRMGLNLTTMGMVFRQDNLATFEKREVRFWEQELRDGLEEKDHQTEGHCLKVERNGKRAKKQKPNEDSDT